MTLPPLGEGRSSEECSSPFVLVLAAERAGILSECLAALPARARAVVAMRYGAGMSLLAAMRRELARRGITRFEET